MNNNLITIQKASKEECNWYGLKDGSYILRACKWFPTEIIMGVINGKYADTNNLGCSISGNLGSAGIGVINIKKTSSLLKGAGYELTLNELDACVSGIKLEDFTPNEFSGDFKLSYS